MTSFLRAFATMTGDFARTQGTRSAAMRALASSRVLAFPGLMRQMRSQSFLDAVARKRGIGGAPWDPFHFLSHPGYLVSGYGLEQRFRAALYHMRIESHAFDEAFVERIYAPEGLELWAAEVDGHRFSMALGLPGQDSLEGDVCVRLRADGRAIGSMNFVWADRAAFGAGDSAPTLFITRNQTHVFPELTTFRGCFKQNSPPYFCLAALAGIAQACGMSEIYAVHSTSQMSYLPQYQSSFRNSYDEFWEKYNAQRPVPEAWRLVVPLELRDLSELRSKHRSRAEQRRRAWGEVGQAAAQAVARHWRGLPGSPSVAPASPVAGSATSASACCAAALLLPTLELLRVV